MGLDMYLVGRTFVWGDIENPENDPKRDGFRISGYTLDLGYWRKHPNLHGYIVREFAGGVDECQEIPLSADNIRKIISAIKHKKLPPTTGFFFGASDGSEDAESIRIFERAWRWLEDQKPVVQPEPIDVGGVIVQPINVDVDVLESRAVVYKASW